MQTFRKIINLKMQIWNIGMYHCYLKLKEASEQSFPDESFPDAIEPYNCSSTDCPWRLLYAIGGGILTLKLLYWGVHTCSQKNKSGRMLQSKDLMTAKKRGLQLLFESIIDDPSFENLPRDILGEIGNRLASRLDIVRFRSVCKQWRSSLPAPSRFPLKVPPPPSCNLSLRHEYFITEVDVYSILGFHLALEEGHQHGNFAKHFFISYWRISLYYWITFFTDTFMPTPFDYSDIISQLRFVSKAYHIRMGRELKFNDFARKMVIISANEVGVNPSYANASDLIVVALLTHGNLRGRLALLRLGGSPVDWNWEIDFYHRVFEDITTYKGKLCALDYHRRIFLMDYRTLQMSLFAVIPPDCVHVYQLKEKHLYEVCGELYVADRGNYKRGQTGFRRAFKLDMRSNKWLEVKGKYRRLTALMPFVTKAAYLRPYSYVPDPLDNP